MTVPKLIKKRRYRFEHMRKGTFEGIFLGMEKAHVPDEYDKDVWLVAMDTSEGTGNEWLRRTAGSQSTTSGIRPSLVTKVEEVS